MTAGRTIQSSYKPAWWLPDPHSQTLWPYMFRRNLPDDYTNERLELPDGDFVDLCWTQNSSGPIVAVFHGLEGNISSPYAAAIMAAVNKRGWRGVFMHFRGCSGESNRLDRSYHSGDTGDISFLISTLQQRYPGIPIVTIGYSLGGNAMLKYLGEADQRTPVTAAVAISVPFVLHDSATRLSQGLSRLYQRRLILSLKDKVRKKFTRHKAPINLDRLRQLDTFFKFDNEITAPLHGFRDADEYYQKSSCRQYLSGIYIPTLIIHASNDPFMTSAAIPKPHELAENVMLEVAEAGGHVGFVSGKLPWKPIYWLEQRITEYLEQFI